MSNSNKSISQMHEENNGISIVDVMKKSINVLKYLIRKWRLFLLIGLLGTLIGLAYSYMQKTHYIATLSFAMEDDKSSSGGLGGALSLASQFGIDLGSGTGDAFNRANILELMKSRAMIEKTLLTPIKVQDKQTTLAQYYIGFTKVTVPLEASEIGTKISFDPNLERGKFSLLMNKTLEAIYEKIIRENLSFPPRDKKVSILAVSVNSINELFSKLFCEQLTKEVSDFYVETKNGKSKRNVAILEHQTDSVRTELNIAISGAASANDNTYNLNPAMNIHRVPSTKKQVDVQANTAILTQLVANLELARINLRKETPLIQIIDTPILPLTREKTRKITAMGTGGIAAVFLLLIGLISQMIFNKFRKDYFQSINS